MENIGGVAEGTTIVDAGAGDGGTGAGGDGGAGTSGGAGEGAGTGGEGGAGGEDGGTGEGEGEGSGEGEGELGEVGDEGADGEGEGEALEGDDSRRIDAKTRQDLAALKKVNPESAKRLGDMYHRTRSIMEEVGAQTMSDAVHKVRQLNATLDGVGGAEGLTQLQDEVGDYRQEIQQFADGDPALLTQLHEANPESFGTAIQNGLGLLAEKNPKLFDQTIVGPMVQRLETAGMYAAFDEVVKFVQEGKGQEAYDKLAQIKQWLNNAKQIADGHKTARASRDPRSEEIDRRARELDQRERTNFESGVGEDVNRMNNRATFKLVDPMVRDLKLPLGGRREFVNALNSRIYAAMKKDQSFQRAANSLLDKGDRERAARFTHAKFAELLPDTFRKLRNEMYPNYKPRIGTAGKGTAAGKGAPANGNKGNGAPPIKPVTGKVYPKSAVDIFTTPDVLLVTGKAYLKGTTTPVLYERG